MSHKRHIVSAVLGDGTQVSVEAVGLSPEFDVAASKLSIPFDLVLEQISHIASSVRSSIEPARPTCAVVEFGVSVGVETGGLLAFIAKGSGEANFKITLEWKMA
jgi:hypothetical protein